MTVKQNVYELNVIMKNGSKANLDQIKQVKDLYVDRKIINVKTAKHLVVQLAHPTERNINSAENHMISLLSM